MNFLLLLVSLGVASFPQPVDAQAMMPSEPGATTTLRPKSNPSSTIPPTSPSTSMSSDSDEEDSDENVQPFPVVATAALMTQLADTNGDGALDDAELSAVMKYPEGARHKISIADFDTNKDGKIDPNEVVAIIMKQLQGAKPDPTLMPEANKVAEDIVKMSDKNGDGALTSAELAAATGHSIKHMNHGIAFMDKNGDGKVTPAEATEVVILPLFDLALFFVKLQQAFPSKAASPIENMKAILKLMDKNNDGAIDAQELATSSGRSSEDAQAAIQVVDMNGDDKITPEEAAAFSPELIDLYLRVLEQQSKNPIKRKLLFGLIGNVLGFPGYGYGYGYGHPGYGYRRPYGPYGYGW